MGDTQMVSELARAEYAREVWVASQYLMDEGELALLVDRPLAWVEYALGAEVLDGDELLYFRDVDL